MCKKILGITTENKKGSVWAVLSGIQQRKNIKRTFICESWQQCRLLQRFDIKLLVKIMCLRTVESNRERGSVDHLYSGKGCFHLYSGKGCFSPIQ